MERLEEKKVLVLITSLLCLMPMIVGLIFYKKLPEQIATHFNSLGEADGYSSRTFAVFGTGAIMLGVHLLCLFITTADPKNRNVSDKVMDLIFWAVPAVSLYITFLLYGSALGFDFDVSGTICRNAGRTTRSGSRSHGRSTTRRTGTGPTVSEDMSS